MEILIVIEELKGKVEPKKALAFSQQIQTRCQEKRQESLIIELIVPDNPSFFYITPDGRSRKLTDLPRKYPSIIIVIFMKETPKSTSPLIQGLKQTPEIESFTFSISDVDALMRISIPNPNPWDIILPTMQSNSVTPIQETMIAKKGQLEVMLFNLSHALLPDFISTTLPFPQQNLSDVFSRLESLLRAPENEPCKIFLRNLLTSFISGSEDIETIARNLYFILIATSERTREAWINTMGTFLPLIFEETQIDFFHQHQINIQSSFENFSPTERLAIIKLFFCLTPEQEESLLDNFLKADCLKKIHAELVQKIERTKLCLLFFHTIFEVDLSGDFPSIPEGPHRSTPRVPTAISIFRSDSSQNRIATETSLLTSDSQKTLAEEFREVPRKIFAHTLSTIPDTNGILRGLHGKLDPEGDIREYFQDLITQQRTISKTTFGDRNYSMLDILLLIAPIFNDIPVKKLLPYLLDFMYFLTRIELTRNQLISLLWFLRDRDNDAVCVFGFNIWISFLGINPSLESGSEELASGESASLFLTSLGDQNEYTAVDITPKNGNLKIVVTVKGRVFPHRIEPEGTKYYPYHVSFVTRMTPDGQLKENLQVFTKMPPKIDHTSVYQSSSLTATATNPLFFKRAKEWEQRDFENSLGRLEIELEQVKSELLAAVSSDTSEEIKRLKKALENILDQIHAIAIIQTEWSQNESRFERQVIDAMGLDLDEQINDRIRDLISRANAELNNIARYEEAQQDSPDETNPVTEDPSEIKPVVPAAQERRRKSGCSLQ